jgi:hypothetical protein
MATLLLGHQILGLEPPSVQSLLVTLPTQAKQYQL